MTVPSIEPRSPIEPSAVSSAPDSLCCEVGRGVGVILPRLGPRVRHPHRAGCRKVALGLDCGEEGKGGEGQSVGLPFPTLHLLYPPASLERPKSSGVPCWSLSSLLNQMLGVISPLQTSASQ